MKKRLISLLLAFSMMLTFLPAGAVSAFAEENIGDIIADGATITQGGTYRLSGEYTKRITINTSDPVTINIAKGDTIKNTGSDLLLEVEEGGKLTLNNKGTYEGEDFLYFEGDKAEISGGKYIITRGTAFTFVDGNPIVVDGIEIQGKTNTDGIKVGALRGIYANKTPNVKIKNSTINVNGDLYGAIYVEGYKAEATLDNVTAHAISRPTIIDYAGKLTINSGRYTNNNCTDVIVSNMASAMKVDVIINGGEFEGGTNVKPTLDVSTRRGYPEATLKIHGGTFTSTQSGLVLRNYATVKIDSSISMPKFYSQSGSLNAIENRAIGEYGIWGNGNLQFDDGIIEVLGTSKRAALYTCGDEPYVRTVVNGGKIHGAGYGIHVGDGSPVVVLKDVEFENNDADIYLNANQKITIEETFKNNATVGCADPKDGRQLTTATTGEYQKDLNLTSADEDYLVGYKKTADGMEYRCLSKKVGVTVSGLEDEIKAGDSAEFIVTLAHEGNTGNGILTFGDKNGEIEYLDDNGVYQPMPPAGRKIDLESPKNNYTFRITPQETGKQTLTTVVKQGENELARHTTNFAGMPTLTVTGGIAAVEKDGHSLNIVPVVTGDKKTYSVPKDAKVTVTLDKTQIPEGMVFDMWTTGSFSLPPEQNYKAETITFTMKESVDIAAQYRDATIEDDGSTVLGTAALIGTAAVGTMVLGYQAYSLGTEFAGYLMDLPYFPANRSALAVMLWEDAGKPMPESERLYPDVGQEEQDMDLQHAARWAMENDLIPDRNEEGTAPEEMKFYPDNAVSRIDVLKAWQKAQELKKNA